MDRLRPRDPAGYISSRYVGPLNPLQGASPIEVAQAWVIGRLDAGHWDERPKPLASVLLDAVRWVSAR